MKLDDGLKPELTDGERQAFRDLWTVYDAKFAELNAAARGAAASDPALRSVMEQQDETTRQAEEARSRHLMKQALAEDEWSGFLDNLSQQGAVYARQGMPLNSWMVLIMATQDAWLAQLFAAHGADPVRLQASVRALNEFLFGIALAAITREYLRTREAVIRRQQEAIKELSTPVLPMRPGLLILPVIGVIDTARARQLTEQLLDGIRLHRAQVVVMDLTGVPAVDSAVANHLLQTVRAAALLGAASVITGISTDNALTLTRIGVDLSHLITAADLQTGIEEAEAMLGSRSERGVAAGSNSRPERTPHEPVAG